MPAIDPPSPSRHAPAGRPPAGDPAAARTLQCMEIWGGYRSVDQTVATPGLDIWVYSRPHGPAAGGGDVYYASLCGGGTLTRLILADVCGHGDGVAGVAKALRGLMRKHINRKSQTRLVRGLNRAFAASPACERFATAVVATYLTRADQLTVSNAGHPRPFWYSAAAGRWSVLRHDDEDDEEDAGTGRPADGATPVGGVARGDGRPRGGGGAPGRGAGTGRGTPAGGGVADLPLGLFDETGYTQVRLTLGRGDLVLFYTDALIEAASPARGLLGEDGLLALVAALDPADPAAMPAALVAALDAYREGAPADDDATFVLLHHNAGPARPPGLLGLVDVYAKVLGLRTV